MIHRPFAEVTVRVLHCIPSLTTGGAERQFCYLVRGLVVRGAEVHAAYFRGGENLPLLQESGASLYVVAGRSAIDPRILTGLISIVRRQNIQVVQSWLTQMDVAGGVAALLTGVPFVLSERSASSAYQRSWKNRLRRLIGARADAVVANSRGGLEYWARYRPSAKNLLIRNYLPPDVIAQLSGSAEDVGDGAAARPPRILFVGRYHPEKNAVLTAKAVCLVLKRMPNATSLFIGGGPDHSEIERIVRFEGLSGRFVVSGFSASAHIEMRRSSVLVSMSPYEGHPNVIIEGALASCPLVVSDIPAHRETLGSDAAIFVGEMAVDSIARAIEASLSDSVAAAVRARSARAGILQEVGDGPIQAHMELYESLIDNGGYSRCRARNASLGSDRL
jgi:glycosyltransferase involved in cell wall biosynthesis